MRIGARRKSQANQVSADGEGALVKTTRAATTADTATTASEEDVFARLVSEEVTRTQSSEIQTKFQELVDKQLRIRTRADGSVNMEKVMKGALKWASNEKQALMTRDDAEKIYSRTFDAAQLDSNTEVLDDSSVSGATMNRDAAFEKARVKLEKLVSGETETPVRNLNELVTSSILSMKKTDSSNEETSDSIEDILLSNSYFQI